MANLTFEQAMQLQEEEGNFQVMIPSQRVYDDEL